MNSRFFRVCFYVFKYQNRIKISTYYLSTRTSTLSYHIKIFEFLRQPLLITVVLLTYQGSNPKLKWCSSGAVSAISHSEIIDFTGFYGTFQDTTMINSVLFMLFIGVIPFFEYFLLPCSTFSCCKTYLPAKKWA